MPPYAFGEEKNMKLPVLIASVCFLVVLGVLAYWFVSNPIKETEPATPTVPGGATPSSTSSITTVTRVAEKVPVPPAFKDDKTNAERKETLFALAKKSAKTSLSLEERTYILQEFGGERAAVYGFTYGELKLIVDVLNR